MVQCRSPTCVVRGNKCVRPNYWNVFQAKQSIHGLTRQQCARKYKSVVKPTGAKACAEYRSTIRRRCSKPAAPTRKPSPKKASRSRKAKPCKRRTSSKKASRSRKAKPCKKRTSPKKAKPCKRKTSFWAPSVSDFSSVPSSIPMSGVSPMSSMSFDPSMSPTISPMSSLASSMNSANQPPPFQPPPYDPPPYDPPLDDPPLHEDVPPSANNNLFWRESTGHDHAGTVENLNRQFRRASMKMHPDRNPGNQDAVERFSRLADLRDRYKRFM